jgi:hypothetical protein
MPSDDSGPNSPSAEPGLPPPPPPGAPFLERRDDPVSATGAPGAELPRAIAIPEQAQHFVPSAAWSRRRVLGVVGNALLQTAIFFGIVGVLNLDHLGTVPMYFWGLGVGIGLMILIAGVTRPGPIALTIDRDGVTYEDSSFTLRTGWANVTRIVQLGRDETTLALRLGAPSASFERSGRVQPWRRVPYPWDATIPLAPFTDGDASREAQALVAGALPHLSGIPSLLEAPHSESLGRRVVGFVVGVVPLAVLALVVNLMAGDPAPTAVLRMAIIGGLGAMALLRWNGTTGERIVDQVTRLALGPSAEPRWKAVSVILRAHAVYIAILLLTLSVSLLGTANLEAKYGPPHVCWKNDEGKISGCLLATGAMRGAVGTREVTCFFVEPLPSTPQTFHCK